MPAIPGFIGPSNVQRSTNVDNEELINWYLSAASPGEPKVPVWFAPAPGLKIWASTGSGPIRAMFQQDGKAYVVGGPIYYQAFANRSVSSYSPNLNFDSRPATISTNGSGGLQNFITSGGDGYIHDLTTDILTQIADVNFDFFATMGDYIDGRFVSPEGQTNRWRWSAILDGTSWPSLNFAQLEQSSDYIIALKVIHGQVWLFGTKTTVVWASVGGTQVFAPIPGSLMQHGCAAAFSVKVIDNAPFWIGANEHGTGVVYRGTGVGSVPQVISTPAVEYSLSTAPRLSDAIAYTYQDEGHPFYVLYVPTLDLDWVYDVQVKQWHKRGHWDSRMLRWRPHVAVHHMFTFGKHLVGARDSDTIYETGLHIPYEQLV